MIGNYFARLTGSKRNLLALLASSAVFTAGCANMSSTAPSANPFSSPATLSGTIHGGNQPVVGATVTLWFAGQSAPAAGIQAATTTSDSSGSFSFIRDTSGGTHDGTTDTYACPTTGGSPLVYVTSKGGNTQNNGVPTQTNTAAAFIALYGDCSAISASNFVYMSEVTTVATMAAVQQFYSPFDGTLKADGLGQERLVVLNLPNTVNILANAATGLANATVTIPSAGGGSIAPGVSVTATPETNKINTLANIISACINAATAADANCTTLFSHAAPQQPNITNQNPTTAFPNPPTDTLQALYYIFTNPTNGSAANMTALFGLQPAVGAPYQPILTTQPTDWTVGVKYASTSTCGTATGGTGNFISSPTDINIDSVDNVWFGNAQTGGNLSSLSAAGAPLYCVNFDTGPVTSGGTFDSFAPTTNQFNPNVWSSNGTNLWRYNPVTQATTEFPVGVIPVAITADGAGNVYFTSISGTTGSLWVLPGAATATPPLTPLQISNTVGPNPSHVMPDFKGNNGAQGNIWVTSGSTFVAQVAPTIGGMNGFQTKTYTTSGNSYGLSISTRGIFVSSFDTGNVDQFIVSGTTFVSAGGFPYNTPATVGISAPKGIAVDGRANAWITNSGNPSLSAITTFGTATSSLISPSTGFAKGSTFLNANSNLAVDQAGNVWVAGVGNAFLTEIVGAGVPIYAPYAVGLANNRFQTIP
jgi:hypothetical protein